MTFWTLYWGVGPVSKGRIEVITGSMFCGKSEELVRRLRRAIIARKKVVGIKHSSDDRYHQTHIGCHTGVTFEAVALGTVEDISQYLKPDVEVVGIDEGQFFDPGLADLCESLANRGVRVIVAGLDQDSDGRPFSPIPSLMAVAEDVTKLHAVCIVCGDEASRSYHKGSKTHQVEVGAGQYEARCRGCWSLGTPKSIGVRLEEETWVQKKTTSWICSNSPEEKT